jgi:hypothetical protein
VVHLSPQQVLAAVQQLQRGPTAVHLAAVIGSCHAVDGMMSFGCGGGLGAERGRQPLCLGVLIDVEEMPPLAAHLVVLAVIRDAAPYPTTAATPSPRPVCVCEWAEVSELKNSVSFDTFILSSLLTQPHEAACAVVGGPASRSPGVTWRHAATRQQLVIGWVWAGRRSSGVDIACSEEVGADLPEISTFPLLQQGG